MLHVFPFYLCLIVASVLLIMLAQRMKLAYPVLLVMAGLGISFIPGIPSIRIDPELIFVIFLPPLLYEASWAISWKELWRWRRIIGSFAFVVVFFTAFSVALFANYCLPGFTLALGFLLGGIVSPPDAVSAGAILKFVRVPRRMHSILEGESLLNDASSLIVFRFALIAVATGQFVWYNAALSFSWMVAGGVGIGLAVGWLFMKGHRMLPTDANADIVLTLVAPYVMYLGAEAIHSSGVLAVVSGGLLLSTHRHAFLGSSSRLRGVNVWDSLVFVLNGIIFMIIGLELPEIAAGLGEVPLWSAIGYGVMVTLVLILARMLAAYGAVFTTLIARNFIKVADARHPGFKAPILITWTGMRGVVSLAAALSIPVKLADGSNFPERNLILFITFVVILLTLLLQGLTLPALIRRLDMPDPDYTRSEEEVEAYIKCKLADEALKLIHQKYSQEVAAEHTLQTMKRRWEDNIEYSRDPPLSEVSRTVLLAILERQRHWLLTRNDKDLLLDEEIVRKHLVCIDLEEEKLRYL
jgi:Na+/H+ antiporter